MAKNKILIVEDNLKNLKLAKDLLDFAGYGVLSADNAEDAIEIANGEKIDLILLDINLPTMNGFEALKIFKGSPKTADIKCVFFTASVTKEEIAQYDTTEIDGYITKPIDTRKFVKQIEEYL